MTDPDTNPEKATIHVIGSRQTVANNPQIELIVDGKRNTSTTLGYDTIIEVLPGTHTIRAKYLFRKSREVRLTLEANEEVKLKLSFNRLWGSISLKKMDWE